MKLNFVFLYSLMKILRLSSFLFLLFLFQACKNNKQVTTNDTNQQERIADELGSKQIKTQIAFKIIEWVDPNEVELKNNPKCETQKCVANILVEDLLETDMNYHGQFNQGDTLRCLFMQNTSSINNSVKNIKLKGSLNLNATANQTYILQHFEILP